MMATDDKIKDAKLAVPWCNGYHYCTTSFNSGSALVEVMLAACQRLAMVRISDNGLVWK